MTKQQFEQELRSAFILSPVTVAQIAMGLFDKVEAWKAYATMLQQECGGDPYQTDEYKRLKLLGEV